MQYNNYRNDHPLTLTSMIVVWVESARIFHDSMNHHSIRVFYKTRAQPVENRTVTFRKEK